MKKYEFNNYLEQAADNQTEVALLKSIYEQIGSLQEMDDLPDDIIENIWQVVSMSTDSEVTRTIKDQLKIEKQTRISFCAIERVAANGDNQALLTLLKNVPGTELARTLALLAATKAGQLETARILIEKGVDFDYRDDQGCTPLSYALMLSSTWNNNASYKQIFEFINLYLPKTQDFNLNNEQDKSVFLNFLFIVSDTITNQLEINKNNSGDNLTIEEIKAKYCEVLEKLILRGNITLDMPTLFSHKPPTIYKLIAEIDPAMALRLKECEENKYILCYQQSARESFTLFSPKGTTQKRDVQQCINKERECRPETDDNHILQFKTSH